jgi:hypothetical protein
MITNSERNYIIISWRINKRLLARLAVASVLVGAGSVFLLSQRERPAGTYAKFDCETVSDGKGGTEIAFSGTTKNDPNNNQGWTQFTGVVSDTGNIEGSYKEMDGNQVVLSANTDGTGFTDYAAFEKAPLADIAREALTNPAKACNRTMLPWAPSG